MHPHFMNTSIGIHHCMHIGTRGPTVGVKKSLRSVPCNGIYCFRSVAFHQRTFLTRCKHVRQNGKLRSVVGGWLDPLGEWTPGPSDPRAFGP